MTSKTSLGERITERYTIGPMEKKRLSKALAGAGIASRRAAEELIFAGRVQVNGQTVKVPQTHVDWNTDEIYVDGEKVKAEQKKFTTSSTNP